MMPCAPGKHGPLRATMCGACSFCSGTTTAFPIGDYFVHHQPRIERDVVALFWEAICNCYNCCTCNATSSERCAADIATSSAERPLSILAASWTKRRRPLLRPDRPGKRADAANSFRNDPGDDLLPANLAGQMSNSGERLFTPFSISSLDGLGSLRSGPLALPEPRKPLQRPSAHRNFISTAASYSFY